MSKIIKLQNIVRNGYDRMTGKLLVEVTEEFFCEACRFLVNIEDKFCWQCGSKLKPSNLVEHFSKNKQLTDEEFEAERKERGLGQKVPPPEGASSHNEKPIPDINY